MAFSYEQHREWVQQRREQLRDDLAAMFPEPTELSLEIGCGHGHWLVGYAAAHPAKRCLGIDLIQDRIQRAKKKAERAGQGNALFMRAEAFEALDALPVYVKLSEVFVLFPDPWPKKRHWKNRLFCRAFLEELGKRCGEGVRCHFRTDHAPYFEWAEEVVAAQTSWRRGSTGDWPFELETVFQKRAEAFQSLIVVKA